MDRQHGEQLEQQTAAASSYAVPGRKSKLSFSFGGRIVPARKDCPNPFTTVHPTFSTSRASYPAPANRRRAPIGAAYVTDSDGWNHFALLFHGASETLFTAARVESSLEGLRKRRLAGPHPIEAGPRLFGSPAANAASAQRTLFAGQMTRIDEPIRPAIFFCFMRTAAVRRSHRAHAVGPESGQNDQGQAEKRALNGDRAMQAAARLAAHAHLGRQDIGGQRTVGRARENHGHTSKESPPTTQPAQHDEPARGQKGQLMSSAARAGRNTAGWPELRLYPIGQQGQGQEA